MVSVGYSWGVEPQEELMDFPCDGLIENFDDALYRGVTIEASPEVVFRWLCQLRVGPYSYDWIDNLGRRSPQRLTPGMDELSTGQSVAYILELVDFERNRHFTFRVKKNTFATRIFGDAAASYLIVPERDGSCRLLVKLVIRYPRFVVGWLGRVFLPPGDLIMMRRQLLNFKELAEQLPDGE